MLPRRKKRPSDCMHTNLIAGTTVQRCVDCGLSMPRYSARDAVAAMRARLRLYEPPDLNEGSEDEP